MIFEVQEVFPEGNPQKTMAFDSPNHPHGKKTRGFVHQFPLILQPLQSQVGLGMGRVGASTQDVAFVTSDVDYFFTNKLAHRVLPLKAQVESGRNP